MNVKFKKLAMQAGITAALAGASLSAHAVITAVPAPAQLVPLFMWSGETPTAAFQIDTEVRVIAPRAVGADTVIDLLGGSSVDTQSSWNGIQTGLSTSSASTTSIIHWFFMDVNSNEVVNSNFRVTPDDEVYFSAATLGSGTTVVSVGTGLIPEGQPGYLIMVNESAYLGGAPTFSFSAEAWLANEGDVTNGLPSSVVIPVLGMADTADTTTYPTPTNNVIENYASAGAGGPIASPIHTGMRTSSTLDGANYRVFDIPMYPVGLAAEGDYANVIVAWADRNYAAAIANPPTPEIKNGLSGRLFTLNNGEVQTSNGRLTLPNQLNIVPVVPAENAGQVGPFSSMYTALLSNVTFGALTNGGFLKFVVDTVDLPVDWTQQGAYSSVVIFNVPVALTSGAASTRYADDNAELAIDTGFFSSN
ncbi:MAG: hypothetical protein K9K68_06800 [Methylococcaceae bacterium]|nr:hypothetical protein [Methylococcaceae bacterium]